MPAWGYGGRTGEILAYNYELSDMVDVPVRLRPGRDRLRLRIWRHDDRRVGNGRDGRPSVDRLTQPQRDHVRRLRPVRVRRVERHRLDRLRRRGQLLRVRVREGRPVGPGGHAQAHGGRGGGGRRDPRGRERRQRPCGRERPADRDARRRRRAGPSGRMAGRGGWPRRRGRAWRRPRGHRRRLRGGLHHARHVRSRGRPARHRDPGQDLAGRWSVTRTVTLVIAPKLPAGRSGPRHPHRRRRRRSSRGSCRGGSPSPPGRRRLRS